MVAKIRSDETPSIFNFKKGEIMKHSNKHFGNVHVHFYVHFLFSKSSSTSVARLKWLTAAIRFGVD